MNVKILRALCVKLYKTIKPYLNFMTDLFKFSDRSIREKYKMSLIIPVFNQVFCEKFKNFWY